jgi:CheY-like chemotaxis protein
MNVVINAVDSIKGIGTLMIETSNAYLDQSACLELGDLRSGDYVKLRVADNGCGMDSAVMANAFEPFFTTKAKGKGTGLGLSMAYGVIVNHGGSIKIDSEVGKGTAVTIYLPMFEAKLPRTVSQSDNEVEINRVKNDPATDHAVVLLVDDEPLFQSSAGRLLEKMGHTVYVAENGSVAVNIYKTNYDTISLVLLDMLMPGMDAPETFAKLKAINPRANILIISGFDKDENVEKLLNQGACGFIQKPFDTETFSTELTAALQ